MKSPIKGLDLALCALFTVLTFDAIKFSPHEEGFQEEGRLDNPGGTPSDSSYLTAMTPQPQ